jgi:hypothetical protein
VALTSYNPYKFYDIFMLHIMDDRSFGEGCQPDGITVYGGRLDREIFSTVTRGRVPNPSQNWNSLANRLRAFHTFLEYCRQYELKVEFWDVHFSQGSYKQLQRNEKNKAKKYSDAIRTFIDREDDEFAHARGNMMRYLNSSRRGAPLVSLFGMCLSGALLDGAMKVIELLLQWMRRLTLQLVNPVIVSHDRTRPLSKNAGHCLETHTRSHLEVDETDSPDNTTVISHLTTANSCTYCFSWQHPAPFKKFRPLSGK